MTLNDNFYSVFSTKLAFIEKCFIFGVRLSLRTVLFMKNNLTKRTSQIPIL